MKIIVETSARHAHVTAEHLEILFGTPFTVKKELSQPGQFASEQRIDVVGPKNTLKNVMIIGPERGATQVELSATDARAIGVSAPVRESGDVAGSAGATLVGPKGQVEIKEGIIISKRHLHAVPETAKKLGLKNGQEIGIKVSGTGREGILCDTVVRISESYADAIHIDTDEANALGIVGETYAEIIK
jgi:Propanediol utilization protein